MIKTERDKINAYLTIEQVKNLFIYVGQEVIRAKPLLTEVDSAIGDGDHGVGMEVGFKHAIWSLMNKEINNINTIFSEIGKAMITNMGGASGVLFGTFFIDSVKGQSNIERLNLETFASLVRNGLEGVMKRGKAQFGDKTMIDAIQPAVDALTEALQNEDGLIVGLQKASSAANAGKEQTKLFVAKFGRAKSLGERTLGHADAGATTIAIIFQAIYTYVHHLSENGELVHE